jgi:hypothetical protein
LIPFSRIYVMILPYFVLKYGNRRFCFFSEGLRMATPNPQAQDVYICDLCDTKPTQQFCNNCQLSLCVDCVSKHVDKLKYQQHDIVHFKDRKIQLIFPTCKFHTNQRWLIDYLLFYVPLKNTSLIWRRHHCRWKAAKFRPMLGAQGLWAGRDLYLATPAVTRDLGFSSLIRRTAPI